MARPSNRAARQQEITEALMRVMAQTGYERATIVQIAKEARLTPGLVHYHFSTKQDILLALVRRLRERFEEEVDAAPKDLDALIDVALAPRASDAPMLCWIALAGEALRNDEVKQDYAAALDLIAKRVQKVIRAGMKDGRYRKVDAAACAALLVSTLQGYLVVAGTARDLIPSGSAAVTTKAMMRALLE